MEECCFLTLQAISSFTFKSKTKSKRQKLISDGHMLQIINVWYTLLLLYMYADACMCFITFNIKRRSK